MDKLFSVVFAGDYGAIVKSKDDDLDSILTIVAKNMFETDNDVVNEINSFSVNMSLMEKFFRDEHGHFYDSFGDYKPHIKAMEADEAHDYMDNHVEKNVRLFFGDQLAEEFMREYKKSIEHNKKYNGEDVWEDYKPQLSEEFYIEAIKLIIKSESYFGEIFVEEIDLKNCDIQQISIGEL
ncbi:hypothetical protein ACSU6B_23475 [Neobacillus sp. C211]|uniref:hypothetical protein n=1 Tax=unclassified Neobacillus TaxID=2675272 RepID=UPI003979F4C5